MRGIEPAAMVRGGVPFSRWLARLKLDNMSEFDTVVIIDGADSSRHGPVGLGKSNIMLMLILALHPDATIANNIVIKNDAEHYERLMADETLYLPVGLDEAENFYYRRTHGRGDQIERVIEQMSNRKERKYHIGCLPRIWDMDAFMRQFRVQWRLKVLGRGRANLYVRSSPAHWSEGEDIWGNLVTAFRDIPMVPPYLWEEYRRCIRLFKPAVYEKKGRNIIMREPAQRAYDVDLYEEVHA